jgi:vacuolar-type H+-ATPase subunit D/Vma8|tara:strand:+ start:1150 stop:1413 length:264 start_codon:yes stop_codon:yes gene_type:complete
MEDENNYMKDNQPTLDNILRRALEKTVHDMAQSKAAMHSHIEDLEAALDNIITLWNMEASMRDMDKAIKHWQGKFPYLFSYTADEEE